MGKRRVVPRAKTRSLRVLKHDVRAESGSISPEELLATRDRPLDRNECRGGPRPCPLVGCKYNLYLEVSPTGGIKFNFPHLEVEEMKESCSLDRADQGPTVLDNIGPLFNVTRERARQIEKMAFNKAKAIAPWLLEFLQSRISS